MRSFVLGRLHSVRVILDRAWVWARGRHAIGPTVIGTRDHDCALSSLYWVAPLLSENRIIEAFQFCTDAWPYGGITNKEFQIALSYLNVEADYHPDTETLGMLLDRKPVRCVALLPYHFIAIIDGEIVGRDACRTWNRGTTVYCHWTFRF